jgi:hypothetical protein
LVWSRPTIRPLEVILNVRPESSPEVATKRKAREVGEIVAALTVETDAWARLGLVGIAPVGPAASSTPKGWPQTLQN